MGYQHSEYATNRSVLRGGGSLRGGSRERAGDIATMAQMTAEPLLSEGKPCDRNSGSIVFLLLHI